MKSGLKSTEFYLMLGGVLTTALNKKLGLDLDPMVMASLLGAVTAYVGARSWAKKP